MSWGDNGKDPKNSKIKIWSIENIQFDKTVQFNSMFTQSAIDWMKFNLMLYLKKFNLFLLT